MVDLVCCLTVLLFFDIPLFYDYNNSRSLIICCHFFGSNLVFLVSLSTVYFVVNLSIILLSIKSQNVSAVFGITLFEAFLTASVAVCLV